MKRILLLIGLLFSVAYGEYERCYCEFSGEWLYFVWAIDQPYYAIVNEAGADRFSGPRLANTQGWNSGYRAELICYLNSHCHHFKGRWTQFTTFSNSASVEAGDAVTPVIAYPYQNPDIASPVADDAGAIRDSIECYFIDLLYGIPIYYCDYLTLGLEGGIQMARAEMREHTFFPGDDTTTPSYHTSNDSEIWGIGPELIVWFDYRLNRCFSLVGRVGGAGLISKKETRSKNTVIDPNMGGGTFNFNAKDEDYYIFTPTLDLRTGLRYDRTFDWFGCFGLTLEGGYEIINIHKGINRLYFVDNFPSGQSFIQYMDFTLHGPYFRVNFSF